MFISPISHRTIKRLLNPVQMYITHFSSIFINTHLFFGCLILNFFFLCLILNFFFFMSNSQFRDSRQCSRQWTDSNVSPHPRPCVASCSRYHIYSVSCLLCCTRSSWLIWFAHRVVGGGGCLASMWKLLRTDSSDVFDE